MTCEVSQVKLIESLVKEILSGRQLTTERLNEALTYSTRAERFRAFKEFAIAFAAKEEPKKALVLAQRAFVLWDGEPGFIDSYLDWLRASNDAEGLRKVSKRAGMQMIDCGNLMEALHYFNIHQYAYQSTCAGDYYEYDRDILAAIKRSAGSTQEHNFHKKTNA